MAGGRTRVCRHVAAVTDSGTRLCRATGAWPPGLVAVHKHSGMWTSGRRDPQESATADERVGARPRGQAAEHEQLDAATRWASWLPAAVCEQPDAATRWLGWLLAAVGRDGLVIGIGGDEFGLGELPVRM